jgi:predicted ATP-grasp superfamily ATP-dependent carboligase
MRSIARLDSGNDRGTLPPREVAGTAAETVGGVVIGGDYQGLGIARSLGRHGIPVCVVDDEISVARASRFVQTVVRVRDLRTEASLLRALALTRDTLQPARWVLYPTRDETVAALAANREALLSDFRVPVPGMDSIRHAWDKRETYRLATRLAVPIPRTWFPATGADLATIEGDGPFVIKPAIKEHFFYDTGVKAWRADTRAQLAVAFRRAAEIAGKGEVIVQELIPGGGGEQYAYCAFFRRGEAVASMTVRRRRQHPSDFGRASTYVETVSVRELADPSIRFLRAIRYYGLIELEYKRDPRDGGYKLLDVNARTWGYHTLGQSAGVDFPYLLFRDQVGAPVGEAHARPDVRWIRLATDLPNAVRDIRAGTLRPGDYLRSLRGVDTEAVFSFRDPLPSCYEIALLPYLALKRGLLPAETEGTVFEATHPFAFFDYFRVPYTMRPRIAVADGARAAMPVHQIRTTGQPGDAVRSLLWLGTDADPPGLPANCRLGRYRLRNSTFFGHVAVGAAVPGMLGRLGHGWHPAEQISDSAGHPRAAVWRDGEGNVFLPFDPAEVMQEFWSEKYRQVGRSPIVLGGRAALVKGYYLVRPALPRRAQLRLRRAFTQVQQRASFPAWPVEESLHNLYAYLFGLLAELAARPVPFIGPWPEGRSWALVLTHDVETDAGYRCLDLLRGPERELGYRSSWNFVPLRYNVALEAVRKLREEGCEVGVHGLRHDGHDLGSRRLLAKRLPAIREYADRWQAVGFRSPATQRQWEWMPALGFDYDSSYSDTDPYEPQPGGCCSYLPYFNASMVELPITLPQDHTLFAVLQRPDADLWIRKAQLLRERHAMVLALTHPDYAADQRVSDGYRSLLTCFRGDPTVWHALPREVAAWWRQRACSAIRGSAGTWRIEGPAAHSGRIRFAYPDPHPTGLGVQILTELAWSP